MANGDDISNLFIADDDDVDVDGKILMADGLFKSSLELGKVVPELIDFVGDLALRTDDSVVVTTLVDVPFIRDDKTSPEDLAPEMTGIPCDCDDTFDISDLVLTGETGDVALTGDADFDS